MKRSQAITTVAVSSGIVIAGTIAAVAMVQATADQNPQASITTVALSASPNPDLSYTANVLPELPTLGGQDQPVSAKPEESKKAKKAKSDKKSESRPTELTSRLTVADAEQAVLAQTPGKIVSAKQATVNGISAFAVQVSRPDGSVVTGFVDASTGTVFEWAINKQAASPTSDPTNESYNDDHESDHEDEHEDELEDDHDGDDD